MAQNRKAGWRRGTTTYPIRRLPRGQLTAECGSQQPWAATAWAVSGNVGGILQIKAAYYGLDTGSVDYRAIAVSEECSEHRQVAARLRGFDLTLLRKNDEKLAVWIGLYNTIVVDGIIALEIEHSVREVPGFFRRVHYEIGGYRFAPGDIGHGILRCSVRPPNKPFRRLAVPDPQRAFVQRKMYPQIRFALLCGWRSCAPIQFYSSSKVREELELTAVNFVNGAEEEINCGEQRAKISRILTERGGIGIHWATSPRPRQEEMSVQFWTGTERGIRAV